MGKTSAAALAAFFLFDVPRQSISGGFNARSEPGVASRLAPKPTTPPYVQYRQPPITIEGQAVDTPDADGFSIPFKAFDYGRKDAEHTRFVMAEVSIPSHHRPGGGYRNPWPNSQPAGFRAFLRWRFVERRGHRLAQSPARDSLPRREPAIVRPRAASGYRAVTWVGHATFLLQLGSLNVLTDPVWSERASPLRSIGPRRLMRPGIDLDALPPIDVVLLSHNHYDHLDAATVRWIARRFPDAPWLCPMALGGLLRSFGVRQTVERDWWERIETPRFSATCAPAQHFSARGFGDRNDTLWCSWAIEADNVRVFFGGDTARHPEFGDIASRLGPFDLVMLPIGAYEPRWFMRRVHMNPEDAVEAYRSLSGDGKGAPPCVAMHWGTFRLTDEPVEEPPARFALRWREAGLPSRANWTLAHGETRQL